MTIELKEDSVKFILMFVEANNSTKLNDAIQEHKKTKTMKELVELKQEEFDFDTFDFESMTARLRKHIPALSDTQLERSIESCRIKKDQIKSKADLIQAIIDHL